MPSHWQIEVISKLLAKSVSEPALRSPAIYAALSLRINPIPLLPAKRHEILKDFLTTEEKGSAARVRFMDLVLTEPSELPKPALKYLFTEICKDEELYERALLNPFFPKLPGAREVCVRGVNHSRSAISRNALSLLTSCWPDALTECFDTLLRYKSSHTRSSRAFVANVLGNVDRSHSENLLRELLTDPERIVRQPALISLTKVIEADAIPDLLLALKDPAPLVRIEACEQLAGLKETSVLEALLECSSDVSELVRITAFKAIVAIDPSLAERNGVRFGVDKEYFAHLIGNANGGSESLESLKQDSPRTADLITHTLNQIEDVIDNGSVYNFKAFRVLTHLLVGRLIVTTPFEGISELVQRQLDKITDRFLYAPLRTVNRGSIGKLFQTSELLKLTLRQLAEENDISILGQGLILGMVEGFDGSRPFSLDHIEQCRRLPAHSDEAFRILADTFGPDPQSLYWPLRPPSLTYVEDDDGLADLELAMALRGNLCRWCLYRATPRSLGFLLAAGSPEWWTQIPNTSSLSPHTVQLIKQYGKFQTTAEIASAIAEQFWRGELSKNSQEIELLAGMGVTNMRGIADFGQHGLFLKEKSTNN
jgi:HEAT repeats